MNTESFDKIKENYEITCGKANDISPYCELLSRMANECSSVTEFGIGPVAYGLNSTWGLLHGLVTSEKTNGHKKYLAVDHETNTNINIYDAQKLAKDVGIEFDFIISDSVSVDIDETDLLFIDTDHRYSHLMKELIKHESKVNKYIIIHDTSGKYAHWEDWPYDHESRGELKNSPEKYGLWPCVVDFLQMNSDWELLNRYEENCGMTVIQRKSR
jgi:hypothetical protein